MLFRSLETFARLSESGVEILTIGQYLRPTLKHLPVERFYHPDEFAGLRAEAMSLGFRHVEAGPLVRSSYHARRHTESAVSGPDRGSSGPGLDSRPQRP